MNRQVGAPPKVRVPPNIFDQLRERPNSSSYPSFQGSNINYNIGDKHLSPSYSDRNIQQSDRNIQQSIEHDNVNDYYNNNLQSQSQSQSQYSNTNIRKAFDDDVEREMRKLEANMKQMITGGNDISNKFDSYEQPPVINKYDNNESFSSNRYDVSYDVPSSSLPLNRQNTYEQSKYDNYDPRYSEQQHQYNNDNYQDQRNDISYMETNKQQQHQHQQPNRQQEDLFTISPSNVTNGGVVRRKGSGILNLYKSPTDIGRDEKNLRQMQYAQQLKQQVDERKVNDTNIAPRQRKGDIIDISYSDGYDNRKFPPPSADILRDMYGINASKIQSSPDNGMLFGLDKDMERNLKKAKQDEYRRQLDYESKKPLADSPLKKSPIMYMNEQINYQQADTAPIIQRSNVLSEKDMKRAKQEEYRRQLDYESAESKRLQQEEIVKENMVRNVKSSSINRVQNEFDRNGLMIGSMNVDPRDAQISRRFSQNEYADLLKRDAHYNQETTPPAPLNYQSYNNTNNPSIEHISPGNNDPMSLIREEKALEMAKRRQQQEEYRTLLDQQVKSKNVEGKMATPNESKVPIVTSGEKYQQEVSDARYYDQQYYSNPNDQNKYEQYAQYTDHYNDLYQNSNVQSYQQQSATSYQYPPQSQNIDMSQYEKGYQQGNELHSQQQSNITSMQHITGDKSGQTPVKTQARNRLISDVYGSKGIVLEVSPEMQAGWRPSKKLPDDRTKAAQLEQKAALEKQIAEDRKRKEDEALEIKLREEREEEKVRAELAALNQKELRNKELKKAQEFEQLMATKALQDKMAQDALSRKNKSRLSSPGIHNSPQRIGQGDNVPRVIHTPPHVGSPSRVSNHIVNSPPRVVIAPAPRRVNNENDTSISYLQKNINYEAINRPQWSETLDSSHNRHIPDSHIPPPRVSYRQELQRPDTADLNKYLSDWQRNSQERLDSMIHDRNQFERYGLSHSSYQNHNHNNSHNYNDYNSGQREEDISFVSDSRLVPANPYDQSGLISALRPLGSSIERINFYNDDSTNRTSQTARQNYRQPEDMVEKSLNADSFLIYLDKNKSTPLKSSTPFGSGIALTESFVASSSKTRPPSAIPHVHKDSSLQKLSYSDEKDRLTGFGQNDSRTPGGRPYNRIDDDDYTEEESDEIIVVSQNSPRKIIATPPRSTSEIRSRPLSSMSPGELRFNSGEKSKIQKEESFVVMSPTKEERLALDASIRMKSSSESPLSKSSNTSSLNPPDTSIYKSAAMKEFMTSQSNLSTSSNNNTESSKWQVSSKDKVNTILELQKFSSLNDNTIDEYGDSFEEDDDDELIKKYLKKEQIDFNSLMDSKIDENNNIDNKYINFSKL